ncbi:MULTISPECIES: UDP-N-acetylglucosamine--N-acetylmuramyl-(pentapeptide) pyrophosphoryl-undecaprenol N-acetylglucosamine transferase [Metallosphaera]|uniref:Glycosyltransferase 28, C-terminal domain n=3 Tax=Metallosphaera TaxID=41980 RepID=A4YH37_METS5|nr:MULTISPECIES: glycosyltransferase [Metallosphaera]ABP95739.1 Glycosyltransferase 28, C-terminal domain [Metallosphaera sedula DSM 5348]AIM27723.1 Glycosyltransferase 28, C-terminal domain [Metallosphaera sedula]AKV74579.1 polysaccharide biosynthesis protein [Metallosphaera sedula]AKV76818.1 polysaccharide biosynthesis protein [Metallosphaera sedula]AKV79069.1 polysaccharide biosynthesis protein [Metallosphaera sedula]
MKRLLIIASGGGHTGFAKAIAEYLPFKVDFVIPEGDENSRKLLSPHAEKIYEVSKPRDPKGPNTSLVTRGFRALSQSISLPSYDVVIATGSNHSVIPSLFQRLRGSTLFTLESQDRIVTKGKAVSVLSHFSKGVFLHWKEQSRLYKNGIVVGPILQRRKYDPVDEGFILVTAGTEGFKALFDRISSLGLTNLVMQTGKISPEPYVKSGVKAFSFDPDIERFIAGASLVITHQGKTAMESAVLYGKPTIIVFNKSLTRAATHEDVKLYSEIIGAEFLDDPSTWEDEELLKAIQKRKKPNYYEPGTERLVKVIMDYLE